MVRLISPQGVPVQVTDEKAERLLTQGFKRATARAPKRAPRRRSPADKTEEE